MRWFSEYFFKAKNTGHSAFDEVTDKSYFKAVSNYGFKAAELMFALGCLSDWKVDKLKEFK
jgi:hypothetical protein